MSADAGIKNHWGFRSYAAKGDTAHTLAVNTGNGNLVVTATDFVFPARIPSIMMRTYNSTDTGVMGMLGRGWRFSFEESVTEISPSGDVEYTDTTGAVYTWIKSGSSYSRPTGVFSDLTLESGEFVITMPSGFKRLFDASNGLLKRYEDTNGNQQRFNRDQNDFITKIQTNVGTGWVDLVDFFYSGPRLTGFSSSVDGSVSWTLTYSTNTELLEDITDPEGNQWGYCYDATSQALVSVADPRGNVAQPSYSTAIAYSLGKVSSITDSESSIISFAYNGLETEATDRRGNAIVMAHSAGALALESVELPLMGSSTTTFAWTANLVLSAITDALGNVTSYQYDSNGNVTHITNAAAKTTLLTYNSDNTLQDITTPLGYKTGFSYDSSRNLTKITRPLGQEKRFSYESNGDLIMIKDEEGNTTEFTYDATYGVLRSSSLVYTGAGESISLTSNYEYSTGSLWLTRVISPASLVTEYDCDKLGRITAVSRQDNNNELEFLTTAFEYDGCGNLVSLTEPKQTPSLIVTTFEYNNLNLLASVTCPLTGTPSGKSTSYTYDAEENLSASVRELDATTSYTTVYAYDAVNRLLSVTLPPVGGTPPPADSVYSFTYDAVGNLLTRADAMGHITCFAYNSLNLLETESGPVSGLEFKYEYDADGRLEKLTGQPDNQPVGYTARTFEFNYDDNSRLTDVVDPLYGVTHYEYCDNNQLQSITLPKQYSTNGSASRTYTYDSVGRLAGIQDALGHAVHYEYRRDSLLSQKIDAEGRAAAYTYDGYGRTVRADYPGGAFTSFSLDDNSNTIEIIGPDGFKTAYTYDDRNRLTAMVRHDECAEPVKQYTTTYDYDQLDRIVSIIDPRDRMSAYVYDAHNRITDKNVDANHGQVVDGLNYHYGFEYDLNGRLVAFIQPDVGSRNFEYDELGRLIKATDQIGGEITNTFDLWGMLTKKTYQDQSSDVYEYDALGRVTKQINHLGEYFEYAYDENGNNASIQFPFGALSEFHYNDRDELTTVIALDPSSTGNQNLVENFYYTPNGRMSTYGGTHSEQWQFEYDELGRWTRAYSALGNSASRSYNSSNTLATSRGLKGGSYAMEYNGMRLRTETKAEQLESQNTTTYTWDYLDLMRVDEPDGRFTTFTRDRLGRILSTTQTVGQSSYTTQYEYNWRNQVISRILPGNLCTETYTYDERGLLIGISYTNPTGQITIAYDMRGRQYNVTYPGGMQRGYYYNRQGRMAGDSFIDSAGNFFSTYYSYDKAASRVTDVLDRRYPIGTILPAYLPLDEFGNPIIHTSPPTPAPPIPDYDVSTYTGYSTAHQDVTIELQQKTAGSGPDQIMYAYHTGNPGMRIGSEVHVYADPITGETIVEIIEITGPIAVPLPAFPPGIAPPDFGQTQPNIEHQQRDLDAYGRVIAERTSTGVSQITQDDYDLGQECCGKTAASCEGTLMADAKRRRGHVKEQIDMNKDLLTDGSGALNQVSPPWDVLIPPDGPPVGKITIAYLPEELLPPFPWAQYQGDDTTDEGTVETYTDPITGRLSLIVQKQNGQENFAVPLKYDAFGRLVGCTDTTQTPNVDKQLTNDWLTGNIIVEEDTGSGDTWAHSHSPGQSRITIAYLPEEYMPRWLIRGPHGQVRLDVDANGHVTDFYGYSSWGNRINHENYQSPYKPPPYLDGDYAPVPGFEQFKVGAGTAQDMTQMFGALDVAKESGAAGDGASGNPDVGPGSNSTFLQDGNRGGFYAGGEWHDTTPQLLPAYPNELHLPGTGTDKAPPSAPQTAEDMASQADKRLRDTWGAQRFWGPKPGQQRGSRQLDDYRDLFQPLPAYPPIGGISGPAGFGSWRWVPPGPVPPPPVPLPASPPAGPWPVLPNEDSGDDGDSGGKGGGGNGNTGEDETGKHMRESLEGENLSGPGVTDADILNRRALEEKEMDEADGENAPPSEEAEEANKRAYEENVEAASDTPPAKLVDDATKCIGWAAEAVGAAGDIAGLVKGAIAGAKFVGSLLGAKAGKAIAGAVLGGLKGAGDDAAKAAAKAASRNVDDVTGGGTSPADVLKRNKVQGAAAEEAVGETLPGAKKHVSKKTSQGQRYIDRLKDEDAHEVKSGRTPFRSKIVRQVAKDAELVSKGIVDSYTWHFLPGKTGVGPTDPLRQALVEAGIQPKMYD